MNNPGTTVYVHWYGKLLQGTVINDNDLMGMVAVRIPLMGGHPVALYTPSHVYATPAEAHDTEVATVPAGSPAGKEPIVLPEAKARYLQFKKDNWDHEHNHLQVAALDDFYTLWRTCIALKTGYQVAVDEGAPNGDHSAVITVDTETAEIISAVPPQEPQQSSECQAVLPSAMPIPRKDIPSPTKRQQRSTGRIQYRDTIQTSIFD